MSASTDHLSDEELLHRFNEGDTSAFGLLLRRYERPLYNFILRSVRRRERADELLQETFLRVIQRSHDFKGQSKLSTWLYTIARNLCIDHGRKMVFRRHRSLDAPGAAGTEEGPTLLERTAAPTAGTDREAIAEDLKRRIAQAVEELPEDQREVFLLRQIQGMPFKEVAEVVGVPVNTVKSRMRYALERLQRALSEYRDYVQELQ
ncbi:MAG: RNA polymerase sigma factor [Sandaracinaceae bacterium]